ncbi:LEA type 2 family protein [Methanolobus sp. ZRKC2]|uniref:LEA type 2 family protein n=1 Tax=Methanolobus sp. ZRKC2 TaxID=3125783 RepID=UPI00324324B2
MRKLWIVVGVVVLLILALIVVLSFETRKEQAEALKNTDISLSGIEVNGISTEKIDLNITLNIYNPNDVTARLERMDYTVYANDVRIGSGSFEEPVEIPPNERRSTSTNFVGQPTSVTAAVISTLLTREVVWSVEGVVYFDTPLGTIEQSFDVNSS